MLQVEERPAGPQTDPTHPALGALHDYWLSLPDEDGLPGRQHVDPAAIRELLPWLFMIDVQRPPPSPVFRFRLAGTGIVQLCDFEITGRTVEEAFPDSALELSADFACAMALRRPMQVKRPLPVPGKRHRLIDLLICPLATDGNTIDMLIGLVAALSFGQGTADRQSAA